MLDYQHELKRLAENKQLVEVNLQGAPTFVVAYLLSASEDFLTLAVVSSAGLLSGVTIVRASEVDSLSVESLYLAELMKQIDQKAVYNQALEDVKNIKDFTFDGFAEGLQNSKVLVEITTHNEDTFSGRVVGYNAEVIALDEYSIDSDRCTKRTYFNRETIARISLDVAWIRTISRSLADKNI